MTTPSPGSSSPHQKSKAAAAHEANELKPLSSAQFAFLSYLEQQYYLSGGIPSEEVAVSHGACSTNFYRTCFKSQKFRDALGARGISLRGLEATTGVDAVGILTEQQMIVANAMFDLIDNRSQKKKLTELGVSSQKYQAWLRDPAYQHYIRTRSENLLGDHQHEAHLALLDRVRAGDMSAVKYYNEITGRYVPESARAGDKANVGDVLLGVLEILQRHVKDASLLQAIADDMLALGQANGVQGSVNVGRAVGSVLVPRPQPQNYALVAPSPNSGGF